MSAMTSIKEIRQSSSRLQVPVVKRADNFIQWISRYAADKMYWLEYILSAG